ncbi:MAG TPA: peptidase M20, partial [Nitrolancea sp.]|nr:peptidase M20 [Nitrolancea sp.]
TRAGGTLPVSGIFLSELGAETVSFAWGMPGGNVHAPNENYSLKDSFEPSRRAYCMYLNALAR